MESAESKDLESGDNDMFEVLQGRATRRRRLRNKDQQALSKSMDPQQFRAQGQAPREKPERSLNRTAVNKSKNDEKENMKLHEKSLDVGSRSARSRSRRLRNR